MRATIDRARLGDERARRELATALRPRLEAMARRYAWRSGEDPGDLVGEAWCAVFDALDEIDMSVGEPDCYLVQRARWRILDYLKWSRLRRTEAPDEHPPPADGTDVAGAVVGLALLAELLAALSDTQRIVLVRVLRGETWREVAQALGCSAANIAYHMRCIRGRWEAIAGDSPA